jgi:hypothetical protein
MTLGMWFLVGLFHGGCAGILLGLLMFWMGKPKP